MKRFFSVFLCISLLFTLTACLDFHHKDDPTPSSAKHSETISAVPAETQVPDELTRYLQAAQSSKQELESTACNQLVVILANGTNATIRLYEKTNGAWQEDTALNCNGYIGQNGVSFQKSEGDRSTPGGLYSIGQAFYHSNPAPATKLPTFEITQDGYWVDDSDSVYYNQYVTKSVPKDWNSAEHMIDYPVYEYGFVVNYNTEQIKNAGSAIFFHIGKTPTLGCISTAESNVLAYLAKLDQQSNPHILILPNPDK